MLNASGIFDCIFLRRYEYAVDLERRAENLHEWPGNLPATSRVAASGMAMNFTLASGTNPYKAYPSGLVIDRKIRYRQHPALCLRRRYCRKRFWCHDQQTASSLSLNITVPASRRKGIHEMASLSDGPARGHHRAPSPSKQVPQRSGFTTEGQHDDGTGDMLRSRTVLSTGTKR